MKHIFYSTNTNTAELDALGIKKPSAILVSFARWGSKNLQLDLVERIGYRPKVVMVDSGAFTFAYAKKSKKTPAQIGVEEVIKMGLDVVRNLISQPLNPKSQRKDLIFLKYMRWVYNNRASLDYCLAMDVIGDAWLSKCAYDFMRALQLPVVPVFHRGVCYSYLEHYARTMPPMIALGGTAVRSDNGKRNDVNDRAGWAAPVVEWSAGFPTHMLGTMDFKLIGKIPGISSADGTTWSQSTKYTSGCKVTWMCDYIDRTEEKMRLVV